jgi:dTDP-4-dehydrorhamnose reductase
MEQINNKMSKILVLGINGMAGHIIFESLPKLGNYNVFGLARNIQSTENIFDLDVTDTKKLYKLFDLKFDIIINCIGVLNEDAENNPNKAIWLNSYFPHLLESLTKKSDTKVISISTDCVFSGKKGSYTETDVKDGQGFYSLSKSLGEIINNKDLTIRTSIVGPELNKNGIGLFNWFMSENNTITGFSKAYWSGITTVELAKVIHQTIQQNLTGLIIVGGNSKISKFHLLSLFNVIFKNKLSNILENSEYVVDKSMYSSRNDFNYAIPSYEDMINEMKDWIINHKMLYTHYKIS